MTPKGQRETLVVEPAAAGERLDRFIVRRLGDVSRKTVKRALDGGRVFVDGRTEGRAGRLLDGGETILLTLDCAALSPLPPALPVLYRDEALLAVDKPHRLPAHPTGHGGPNALAAVASLLSPEGTDVAPVLLHRLDADTSGVLLFALSAAANRSLARQFSERGVAKTYLAVVAGASPATFRVENRLRSGVRGRTVSVAKGGQPALTLFRTLERGGGFSLVEASPRTGRTHQIRTHLAEAGYPLLGDTLYGGPATCILGGERRAVSRHLLHAARLSFRHPATGAVLAIEAPLPADFRSLLQGLDAPSSII